MDQLTTMYRNIEVQINQIANSINNGNHGELPSKTEVNLREHINAINLRSGKTVEGPKFGESSGKKDKEVANEEMKENQKDYVVIDIDLPPSNVVTSAIPFPNKLKKDNKDREFEKFLKIFK